MILNFQIPQPSLLCKVLRTRRIHGGNVRQCHCSAAFPSIAGGTNPAIWHEAVIHHSYRMADGGVDMDLLCNDSKVSWLQVPFEARNALSSHRILTALVRWSKQNA